MNISRIFFTLNIIILSVITGFAQAYPDRHSTGLNDGWLSCQSSPSPNSSRGTGHWIMYNLGYNYTLSSSKIWNFNTPERVNSFNKESWSIQNLDGTLEDGLKDIIIDLSNDGITWKEYGRFTIPKAPGSSFYEGVAGPDFNGVAAQYVLITAQSNHGGQCYGLGEVKIEAKITASQTVDPLANAKLQVSPNPFSGLSTLMMNDFPIGNIDIDILDLTGRVVKQFKYTIRDQQESLNLSSVGMPSGLYILQATQHEATKAIKIEILR